MKLSRGVKLTDERVENGELIYTIRVSRWRLALIVAGVLRRGFKYRPR